MGNLNEKLFAAAKDGKLDMLKKVIEKDVKKKMDVNFEKVIDKETKETRTPLGIAIENNHLPIVQELLKHADITVNGKVGEIGTPLTIACRTKNVEVVKAIFQATDVQPPADPNIVDCKGETPAAIAIQSDDAQKGQEIFQELIKQEKFDINKPDGKGLTPLQLSLLNGKLDFVTEILKVQALDPNQGNTSTKESPLYTICKDGKNMEIFQQLLNDERVDLNLEDSKGEFNPLFLLINNYITKKEEIFFTMLTELVKHPKLDVNHARTIDSGAKLPLTFTFFGRGEETEESTRVFKLLFEDERLDIGKGDDNLQHNPVFNVCSLKNEKRLELAKLIMSHPKFDVNLRRGEAQYGIGTTPIMSCVVNECFELVPALLEREGIDLTITSDFGEDKPGLNVLQMCCLRKQYDLVKKFINERGMDPNVGTNDTEKDRQDTVNPLFAACAQDDVELLNILLDQDSINVNRREEPPTLTPLYIACQRGCVNVVKVLVGRADLDVNKGRVDPKGSREDISGKFEESPLSAAGQRGDVELVKVLLGAEGMDPNKGYPKSPWAMGKTEEIKELIGKHSGFKKSFWE